MKDQNCAYCMEGELVAAFGIKICIKIRCNFW